METTLRWLNKEAVVLQQQSIRGNGGAVSVLVIAALFVLTQLYAAIPLLGPVGASMGADATFALSTCFSVTYAVGFLVWGPISDRYGRKKVMTASIGVLAVATLLCSAASSLPMLAGVRALQGAAASGDLRRWH